MTDNRTPPSARVRVRTRTPAAGPSPAPEPHPVPTSTPPSPEPDPQPAVQRRPVGYGSPPVSGQIKPGERRNPKGRPKGSKNTATLVREELDRTVALKGSPKRQSLRQIAIRQQAKQAAEGSGKALMTLLAIEGSLASSNRPGPHTGPTETAPPAEGDQAILAFMRADMLARLRAEQTGTEHVLRTGEPERSPDEDATAPDGSSA